MAQHGHLTRKEKKEIRIKRRALRKDLKRRGIKSRSEFEVIAQQMGLVYGGRRVGLLGLFWKAMDFLRRIGALWLLLAALAILAVVMLYARLASSKADFTIALGGELEKKGFVLSETEDFKDPQVRLKAEPLDDVPAESIKNIPADLDNGAGSHNTKSVFAYTFWVKNAGEQVMDYDWNIILNSVEKEVDSATWMMVYQERDTNDDREEHDPDDPEETYDGNDRDTSDRMMTVYAKPLSDGTPEHLSGYPTELFKDVASNGSQNYSTGAGYGIRTTPFIDDRHVGTGTEKVFWPGEIHKYTVVMWVEGDDPECNNDRLGGKVSFAFKFGVAGEKDELFEDLLHESKTDTGTTKKKGKK